jgi:hypothetical protein
MIQLFLSYTFLIEVKAVTLKRLAQGHMASKQQGWSINAGSLTPSPNP